MTKMIDNIGVRDLPRLYGRDVSASRARTPVPPPPPRTNPGAGLNRWAPSGEPLAT